MKIRFGQFVAVAAACIAFCWGSFYIGVSREEGSWYLWCGLGICALSLFFGAYHVWRMRAASRQLKENEKTKMNKRIKKSQDGE